MDFGRALKARTAAAPYEVQWTGTSDDISITTAAVAPAIMPEEFADADFVNFVFISDDADNNAMLFELVLADTVKDGDAENDPLIIRSIPIAPSQINGARRTDGQGDAGWYFTTDMIVDIRGVHSGGARRWYLCCTGIGLATTVALMAHNIIRKVGS